MKRIGYVHVVPMLAVALACATEVSAKKVDAQTVPKSINSTSKGRAAVGTYTPVPEQPFTTNANYQILVSNDLGMHCGDLDNRIAAILPPFNTAHAQVIQRASTRPIILDQNTVNVVYSAASNPNDPWRTTPRIVAADGSIFKTNFWEVAVAAYGPFYPAGVLAPYLPANLAGDPKGIDIGLPVPDIELLVLGDGTLDIKQHTMPSITNFTTVSGALPNVPTNVTINAYTANKPQACKSFNKDLPFFSKHFPFGYDVRNVKWFANEGVPMAPFDDYGRENPYPLMRFQAKLNSTGATVASLDAVLPVSGESDCKSCHLSVSPGNGVATRNLPPAQRMTPSQDPQWRKTILWSSEEWAADINILKLHDQKHGTHLFNGYNATTGVGNTPVACQSCHYTPALDLLQVGPQGTTQAPANGLQQASHASMSRVMHASHGLVKDAAGNLLFPEMPAPNDSDRMANQSTTPINTFEQDILNRSCYTCHPGKRTQCNRGTMNKAGAVCQDCHGELANVGNDFSRNMPGGGFIVASDFYTNPNTPRVPWANEPTCGSCHTGDANSNLTATANVIAAPDGIRLLQTYRTTDANAKPILPTNLRFAEPRVTTGPATGNPQLYRVSSGHGGVFCEGCHGPTHAEWPASGGNTVNDNVAANQLQGHTGKVLECQTCHLGIMAPTLNGPHGMHPVGDNGNSAAWTHDHEDYMERVGERTAKTQCAACHGKNGQGTVLSVAAVTRTGLKCESEGTNCRNGTATITAGTQVGCAHCHKNELP